MPRPAWRARITLSAAAFPVALAALGLAGAAAAGRAATPGAPPAQAQAPEFSETAYEGTVPVVAEYRFRMAGKVRPLLFFWITRDGVGGARFRVRRGEDGAYGYDLLIGSDPARAPRGINRWGSILEETRGGTTTVVGVMKKSDEETLGEAESNVDRERQGGVVYKMIQASVTRVESVARVTIATLARDYTYRELGALMAAMAADHSAPRIRVTPTPPGGRPGLLTSVAELLRDGVETVRRTGRAPGSRSLPYVYYAKQYDVKLASASVEKGASYGGVTYPRLLRASFELRARGESWTERFTIACAVDGDEAGAPVFVSYQPRWWLAVELVRDDRERF